jgi:uncharacterized membrane protein
MTISDATTIVGFIFALLAIIAWSMQGYYRSDRRDLAISIWLAIAIGLTITACVFWIIATYQGVKL